MIPRLLYLSLGSNLGDRRANIEKALRILDSKLGGKHLWLEGPLETKAAGFDGPDFLDAAACYLCTKKPETVLRICKQTEMEMGRCDKPEYDSAGRRIYHDRIIDIDILMYGNLRINSQTLTIPHLQVEQRPYIKELLP